LNQQKACCLAISNDGIHWEKKGVVFSRHPEHDYENIAVAGPVVILDEGLYRMWYSAIGTRWGYYSICYAESEDGINWFRGNNYGENLQMGPDLGPLKTGWHAQSWDSQMVAYPSVINEGNKIRLFYTGNGYGLGGLGTAISTPLRAVVLSCDKNEIGITSCESSASWIYSLPDKISSDETDFNIAPFPQTAWQGPDPDCTIWFNCFYIPCDYDGTSNQNRLEFRAIASHNEQGIQISLTVVNKSGIKQNNITLIHNIKVDNSKQNLKEQDLLENIETLWEKSKISKIGHDKNGGLKIETNFGDLKLNETCTLCGSIRELVDY
jgi:hypothetical protein